MKKRFLSVFLVLTLCLTLLPTAVWAASTPPDFSDGWTALNSSYGGTMLENGNYYLADDVTITRTIAISGTVTLDLNGKTLKYDGSQTSNQVISVCLNNPNLTLQDSSTGGCIDGGGKASEVYVQEGSFTMNGGSIQNCRFSGVYVCGGSSFTMNDGSIQGCGVSSSYTGGGVTVEENGSFTMNGGSITSKSRYDVSVSGTMNANGGTVGNIHNDGTITRTATGMDADTYTYFSGTVKDNGTIEDAAKLTVTFVCEGSTVPQQKVLKGKKITEPTAPTKTDYAFGGWYSDEACTTEYSFNAAVTSNLTLYAKWKPIYTVTWLPGYEGGMVDTTGATTKGVEGDPITAPTNAPTRAADASNIYTFAGWYTEAEGGDALTSTSTVPKNDVTYYAHWNKTPIYTVTFDPNGGTVDPTSATTDIEGKLTELPTPTRSGSYRFDGWFTERNGGTAVTVDTVYEAHTTVYAQWSDNVAPTISGIENGKTYCKEQTVTVTDDNGIASVTVNGTPVTVDANGQFTLSPASGTQTVVAKDQAGNVSAEMIVTVNDGHEGGTATCTGKAECEVCGEEYGEVDSNNHSKHRHIEAKAVTTEAEGNIEYWHCEDCNKYFSDKDYKNEITLADTVVAKLSDSKAPQTGDNSHMTLWLILFLVSGGAIIGTAVYGKKRKHSAK